MKRKLKSLLAVLLILALMFSLSVVGFAEDDRNKIVAQLSLCTIPEKNPFSGHTWVYVENTSGKPITVGLYEVPAGQGVSVGVFARTTKDGWGIYYNLEAYRRNKQNNIQRSWSITQEITKEQLDKFSEGLISYANHWDPFFNCSFFAFTVWNKVGKPFMIPLWIPALSALEIIAAGAEKGVLTMYYPKPDQVFRQRGSFSDAYLEPVSPATLNG